MPTLYDRKLLNTPTVTLSFNDPLGGLLKPSQVELHLSNDDHYFDGVNLRGERLTYNHFDKLSNETWEGLTGTVVSQEWRVGRVILHTMAHDLSVFQTLLPKEIVTAATFPTADPQQGLGRPIPIVFGNAASTNKVNDAWELPWVGDSAGAYDYLVGRGTYANVSVYRDTVGDKLFLVPGSEYSVNTSAYSGFTVIRFALRQRSFGGGFHRIFAAADVSGSDRRFSTAINTLMSSSTQGLGLTMNAASVTQAAADLDAIGSLYCVSGDTLVTLSDGTHRPIQEIVSRREPLSVLSYDSNSNCITENRITDWFATPARRSEWFRIRIGKDNTPGGLSPAKSTITVTGEHPFWTDRGWVTARNLKSDDHIYRYARGINHIGQQAIVGMLFGDGCISNGHFSVRHGWPQREYAKFIADKLEIKTYELMQPGYRGPNRPVGPPLKAIDCRLSLKTTCPSLGNLSFEERLKKLTVIGLAFWYMDDGNLQQDRRNLNWRPSAQFHTEGMSEHQREAIAQHLQATWNLTIKFYKRNNTAGKLGRLTPESSNRFFGLIAGYVHPSMRYKLPPKKRHVPFLLESTGWRENTAVPFAFKIRPLAQYENYSQGASERIRGHLSTAYNIKIESTQSFIGNGFITHNCDGVITEQRSAQDYLTQLLNVRGMMLTQNSSGEYVLTVDTQATTIKGFFGHGLGQAAGGIEKDGFEGLETTPMSDAIKTLVIDYRLDRWTGKPVLATSARNVLAYGEERRIANDFIRVPVTADKTCCYIANRHIYGDERLTFRAGQMARKLRPGEVIRYQSMQPVFDAYYSCREIDRESTTSRIYAVGWNPSIYTYTAGTLPSEPGASTDTDWSRSTPTAPTSLSIVSSGVESDGQNAYLAKVTLQYTIADESWAQTYVRVRRYGTTNWETVAQSTATGAALQTQITGLITGASYDYMVERVTTMNPTLVASATLTNQTAPADTVAPGAPTALSMSDQHLKTITFQWTAPADKDVKFYSWDIRTAASGGGSLVTNGNTEGPGTKVTLTLNQIAYNATRYFRVFATDFSGNAGSYSASVSFYFTQVANGDLGNGIVATANIIDANITTAKIADANITSAKIGSLAVLTANIQDLNVTTLKIAGTAVTTAKRQVVNSQTLQQSCSSATSTTFTFTVAEGTANMVTARVISTDPSNNISIYVRVNSSTSVTVIVWNSYSGSNTVNIGIDYW